MDAVITLERKLAEQETKPRTGSVELMAALATSIDEQINTTTGGMGTEMRTVRTMIERARDVQATGVDGSSTERMAMGQMGRRVGAVGRLAAEASTSM